MYGLGGVRKNDPFRDLNFRVPEDLYEALRALAYKQRRPMAELARQALAEFMKEHAEATA